MISDSSAVWPLPKPVFQRTSSSVPKFLRFVCVEVSYYVGSEVN